MAISQLILPLLSSFSHWSLEINKRVMIWRSMTTGQFTPLPTSSLSYWLKWTNKRGKINGQWSVYPPPSNLTLLLVEMGKQKSEDQWPMVNSFPPSLSSLSYWLKWVNKRVRINGQWSIHPPPSILIFLVVEMVKQESEDLVASSPPLPKSLLSHWLKWPNKRALWARSTKNTDWSTGPLACPFARSLTPFTRLFAPHYLLCSGALLRSLARTFAHFAHSWARGKVNN